MEIELPDGTVLDAPDGADIKSVVAGYQRNAQRASTNDDSQPSALSSTLKYLGNEAARVGIKAITDIPLAFADVPYAIGNAIQGKPNTNLPSQMYSQNLDENFTPPTTTAGKLSEGASGLIAGGGMGRTVDIARGIPQVVAKPPSAAFQNFMDFADNAFKKINSNLTSSIGGLALLHHVAPNAAYALEGAGTALKAAQVLTPTVSKLPRVFGDNAGALSGAVAALAAQGDD